MRPITVYSFKPNNSNQIVLKGSHILHVSSSVHMLVSINLLVLLVIAIRATLSTLSMPAILINKTKNKNKG